MTTNRICVGKGGLSGMLKSQYFDIDNRKCSMTNCNNIIPLENSKHTCDECFEEIKFLQSEECFDEHGNKCCANCMQELEHNGNYCNQYCYEEAFGNYFDCMKEDSDYEDEY
jgi:hypothetical protein